MNKSKCASMQPVEGGRPYCEAKQTVCDGKCPETNFQRYLSTPERAAILTASHLLHPPGKFPSCECNKGCIDCWLDWLNAPEMEDK